MGCAVKACQRLIEPAETQTTVEAQTRRCLRTQRSETIVSTLTILFCLGREPPLDAALEFK